MYTIVSIDHMICFLPICKSEFRISVFFRDSEKAFAMNLINFSLSNEVGRVPRAVNKGRRTSIDWIQRTASGRA
jgi:hypothetical protein